MPPFERRIMGARIQLCKHVSEIHALIRRRPSMGDRYRSAKKPRCTHTCRDIVAARANRLVSFVIALRAMLNELARDLSCWSKQTSSCRLLIQSKRRAADCLFNDPQCASGAVQSALHTLT